jgi:hypothetical protein
MGLYFLAWRPSVTQWTGVGGARRCKDEFLEYQRFTVQGFKRCFYPYYFVQKAEGEYLKRKWSIGKRLKDLSSADNDGHCVVAQGKSKLSIIGEESQE